MSGPPPRGLISADDIEPILDALVAGLVVGIPTDTVYGLAGRLDGPSVRRIFDAKGRPSGLALPVLVGGLEQLDLVASSFPPTAAKLAGAFWPGALTVVVRAKRSVGAMVGGNGRTVGVRWPDHPLVEQLCLAVGPLAVTSANHHGQPPAASGAQLREQFTPEAVALVVDGGECAGLPSSVVDCSGRAPWCLRDGAVPWSKIEALLASDT